MNGWRGKSFGKPRRFLAMEGGPVRFEGRAWKERGCKWWLAEVPLLDVMTQGKSERDVYRMIADAVEFLIDQEGFKADVHSKGGGKFTLGASHEGALLAFMLKRQREAH